jgi:hypothetical protein
VVTAHGRRNKARFKVLAPAGCQKKKKKAGQKPFFEEVEALKTALRSAWEAEVLPLNYIPAERASTSARIMR